MEIGKNESNGITPSSSKSKKDFQSLYEGMETENAKIANVFEGASNDEGRTTFLIEKIG